MAVCGTESLRTQNLSFCARPKRTFTSPGPWPLVINVNKENRKWKRRKSAARGGEGLHGALWILGDLEGSVGSCRYAYFDKRCPWWCYSKRVAHFRPTLSVPLIC